MWIEYPFPYRFTCIDPSAWKANSQTLDFRFTAFSEVG
jgi:hypothetical protein